MKRKASWFLLGLAPLLLFSPLQLEAMPKIQALLIVKDFKQAANECEMLLREDPKQERIWECYLEALGYLRDAHRFSLAWKEYLTHFPAKERRILELGAWGILEQGSHSSSPMIRIATLFGAALSNDAKGIVMLAEALQDSNAAVRATTVHLAGRMRDDLLKTKIFTSFFKERDFRVKVELILALGQMQIHEARPHLLALMEDLDAQTEERLAAIEALVSLEENASLDQVNLFAKSKRAGFRLLACQLASHFYLQEAEEILLTLLQDPVADVRFFSLQTLGYLGLGHKIEGLERYLYDPNREVAVAAAWVLLLRGDQRGEVFLKQAIQSSDASLSRLAASTLQVSGSKGFNLANELISAPLDPFSKLSVALALALEKTKRSEACTAMAEVLKQSQDRWSSQSKGMFEWMEPSLASLNSTLPGEREIENIQMRLNCLNLLSLFHYENVKEALTALLEEKLWGVSAGASVLLLTEGDAEGIDQVRTLLKSKEVKVRTQAALILALWGKDEEAISSLEEIYPKATRELKEKILEGLGGIGSSHSIPFLAEQMKDSSPILRILAASSLLQCLYR